MLLITHNITEAVQLADRILVMTYRPGRVKRMVDIKLPRPRTSEIVSSEAFGRYVAQIWSDLREEASRGSTTTSRARYAAENTRRTNHGLFPVAAAWVAVNFSPADWPPRPHFPRAASLRRRLR